MLSDDILFNTFSHFLGATPRFWPTLASVCHRWRQIVLASPLSLKLRIYCTYGTPVLKTIDCWPALPISVQYGGVPNLNTPTSEDEENIISALKQSGSVNSIGLTVTNSLLERISANSGPFSELEELILLSRDNMHLTLPSGFRWGTRLRTLRLTGIAIPAPPRLLYPSTGLVDLQLHEVPSVRYLSPHAFANALSEMTQLESISLQFLPSPHRNHIGWVPASGERVVLPVLTCFRYRGACGYLDGLVARICSPRLANIGVTLSREPTMDASELGRFIERMEIWMSLSQVDVQTSADTISICLSKPGAPPQLELRILCEQLGWQLSSMTEVCSHLVPLRFRVKDLRINSTQQPSWMEDMDDERWPELIRVFASAEDLRVDGAQWHVTDILCALRPADGAHTTNTTVLPSLRNLRVENSMAMYGPSWDAVQSLITSRWLSGRPVQVYAREYSCHICLSSFTGQQELKLHLVDKHLYRIVCSYCGDFEWSPGYNRLLFREHLESIHPEVARNDPLISMLNPLFTHLLPFQHDSLADWHGSLRAPGIVTSSAMVTASRSQ